jgi:hypothetical protein
MQEEFYKRLKNPLEPNPTYKKIDPFNWTEQDKSLKLQTEIQ